MKNLAWDAAQLHASICAGEESMKKATAKTSQADGGGMRAEYDFTGGVRGRHFKEMLAGYTVTIHQADGSTVVKEVKPVKGAVVLEPDAQALYAAT